MEGEPGNGGRHLAGSGSCSRLGVVLRCQDGGKSPQNGWADLSSLKCQSVTCGLGPSGAGPSWRQLPTSAPGGPSPPGSAPGPAAASPAGSSSRDPGGRKGVSHPSAWGARVNPHPACLGGPSGMTSRLLWVPWGQARSPGPPWARCPAQVPPGSPSGLGSLGVTPGSPRGRARRRKEASPSSLGSWSLPGRSLTAAKGPGRPSRPWAGASEELGRAGSWLGALAGAAGRTGRGRGPTGHSQPLQMLWEGPCLCAPLQGVSPSPGKSPADQSHPGPCRQHLGRAGVPPTGPGSCWAAPCAHVPTPSSQTGAQAEMGSRPLGVPAVPRPAGRLRRSQGPCLSRPLGLGGAGVGVAAGCRKDGGQTPEPGKLTGKSR